MPIIAPSRGSDERRRLQRLTPDAFFLEALRLAAAQPHIFPTPEHAYRSLRFVIEPQPWDVGQQNVLGKVWEVGLFGGVPYVMEHPSIDSFDTAWAKLREMFDHMYPPSILAWYSDPVVGLEVSPC